MAMTMKTKLIDVKENLYSAKATGAVALAETLAPGVAFELKEVRIHLSAAGTAGDFTITMDNDYGANYDVVLFTQDMTSLTSLAQTYYNKERRFKAEDELDFAWANASARTYGMEVIYKLY